MIQFWGGICPVPFTVWGISVCSDHFVSRPLHFVCKSQRLLVHGRLVNTQSRIGCGSLTSGKTFALKYCLSSSSMSALGLQDNICSPHVPKTWQPVWSLRQRASRTNASSHGYCLPHSFTSLSSPSVSPSQLRR